MLWLQRKLESKPLQLAMALIVIATVLRIVVLFLTPLNLGPDEAQYWSWGLKPDFGYFSKPPFIAWIIGSTTYLCGVDEACVRISAPFFHAASSLFIFLAARALYDEKVGFWSAITYLLIPGTSFSSLLITTDVPLLCFWALALWALAEMRRSTEMKWAVLLGCAVGLGLLSKYAMLYFVLGLLLAFLPTAEGRALLASRPMAIAVSVAALIFSPNLIWNLTNSFATVRHTASNANWSASKLFNFGHIFEFLIAQAGIIGPIAAVLIIWGFVKSWREKDLNHPDTLMLTLSLPIIAIVAVQAFISRANANWAAPAFVTLCILFAAWAVRKQHIKLIGANTLLNASIGILLAALAVSPAFVAAIGQENSVKRLRGWEEAGHTIITIASSAPFTSILSDDREDMASLYYYTRDRKIPLRMWPSKSPGNEYEASYALSDDVSSYVLFVTRKEDVTNVTRHFSSHERIGTIETRLDSKRKRVFYLHALKGPSTASTYP